MDLTTILTLTCIGFLAGTLSGVVGIGGGLIMIPLMMLFLGMDQLTAQGTSLAVMLLPVGILAAYNYYQSENLKINYALIIATTFILGGYFGSKLAMQIHPQNLRKFFAFIMFVASIKMFFSKS